MARAASFYRGFLFLCFALGSFAADFDIDQVKKDFLKGDYDKVIEQAGAAIKARERGEEWPLYYAHALWMTGKYPEARDAIKAGQRNYYYSLRIRVLAHKLYRSTGDLDESNNTLDEINSMAASNRRWNYRDPLDLLALGQAAVLMRADPRAVLDNFFQPVKKSDPNLRDVYLCIGDLALQKHDFALAGKSFQEGLQKFPKDPDLLAGLATALASSDRKEMLKVIEKVFAANPNHIAARLLLVEHLVDAEEYDDAGKELARIEAVNPNRPEMWAYRALLAHLKNDSEGEERARSAGLKYWTTNPEVDHIIGRKLSQKYRFGEGSEYQRQAMKFDITYLPAHTQLAEDLLRLGQEDEGWRLAERVNRLDAYDVTAFNLVTLHDTMKKFVALTNDHFTLKMSEHEADVYGKQALDLLERARATLIKKYGAKLERPTTVEIFPQQKDFAVRTFGIPGQEGYLGVCFGNVITANSPASHTMNWNSVLWHEFCHVITLNLTKNKMPRWLSEGISVYEERRADPRWGEQMNPQYREMILDDKMKPIDEMSSAFMAPPSGLYLQFAYYESSLVVEFIVEKFGIEAIRGILNDLGEGKDINETIAAHTTDLHTLQEDFEKFAEAAAKNFGPSRIWDKPKRDDEGEIELTWAASHKENFWVLKEKAEKYLEKGKTNEAIPLLEKTIELYPRQKGDSSAYSLLASIYRKSKDTEKEREVLRKWARNTDEASDALLRLLELDTSDPKGLQKNASTFLEINPLTPQPYRALALADEKLGNPQRAIQSYETVLKLDPADPADVHYRLAKLFEKDNRDQAKRHVLLALEEAPRFRDAHRLLLQLEDSAEKTDQKPKTKSEKPAGFE